MDLYLEESGTELLKKTKLLLNAVLDEKELDEIYKKRIKKKVAINLQIAIKHLELYIARCELTVASDYEIQVNIDIAKSIIKLLEASLGSDNSERFEEYYNTASSLLSDLKDMEEEKEAEEPEEDEIEFEEWSEEEEIEDEKETNVTNEANESGEEKEEF
ncbi:MAG: hypothetical protein ACYDDB_03395 [bacterium]